MLHRSPSVPVVAMVLAFGGVAMAEDTTFVIENRSELDIVETYAYPSHLSEGPGEPLPHSSIPAGASVEFTIVDGNCAYELYFTFGDERWYHGTADFCEFDTYVFTPVPSGWIEIE